MTRRVPKPPRPVTQAWHQRLIVAAQVGYLPMQKRATRNLLVPWAGLLTLVGPPGDSDAEAAYRAFRKLLIGRGRSGQWADAANAVPAERDAVLALSRTIEAYEAAANEPGLTRLGNAAKLSLRTVVPGMLRVSRAPAAYCEAAAGAWCTHPNAVFSDTVMDELARGLRGLLGDLPGDASQDDELKNVPRV